MKQKHLPDSHVKLLNYLKLYMNKHYNNIEKWHIDTPRKKPRQINSIKDVAKAFNQALPQNMELVITLNLEDKSQSKKNNFIKGIHKLGFQTTIIGSSNKNWIVVSYPNK